MLARDLGSVAAAALMASGANVPSIKEEDGDQQGHQSLVEYVPQCKDDGTWEEEQYDEATSKCTCARIHSQKVVVMMREKKGAVRHRQVPTSRRRQHTIFVTSVLAFC